MTIYASNHEVERLPRIIPHKVISIHDLEPISNNCYMAKGYDPHIILELAEQPDENSKAMIRMTVIVEGYHDRINSAVYLPWEHSYHGDRVIKRNYACGEQQEFIIESHKGKGYLRYDPHNMPGFLHIFAMRFQVWSDAASYASMLLDVKRRHTDPSLAKPITMSDACKQEEIGESCQQQYSLYRDAKPEGVDNPYGLWIKYTERSRLHRMKKKEERKGYDINPKFSIVVPVYNTDSKALRECIDSVLQQSYENWELCLVDDASSTQEPWMILQAASEIDQRIRIRKRTINGHICEATNSAIAMTKGHWIVFLDHDDALAPQALERLCQVIEETPNARLIYSDEDFLDPKGNRINPHFKSDWNRDLLYSHNYITHLVCVTSDLVDLTRGLQKGKEGAQDYDFLLRIIERLDDSEIVHIPEILYHWRISEMSTAHDSNSKPYTVHRGREALTEHLQQAGKFATVESLDQPNFYRVHWEIAADNLPLVSIIIPTRDRLELISRCVETIHEYTQYSNYEIIIVDNESIDPSTIEWLFKIKRQHPGRIRVIRHVIPFNYSALNNYAASQSRGSLLCLLNNDTEVLKDQGNWLGEMVSQVMRPEVGCVGAKLLYPDSTIQHAGVILTLGGVAGHSHKGWPAGSTGYFNRLRIVQEMSAVTGACLMIRKKIYELVKGLDEKDFPIAYNDVDLCLKVRSEGFHNIYTPNAILLHHESKSRGYEDTKEKKERLRVEQGRLLEKWPEYLARDPFYNINLTTDREDFSIRIPPGH